MRINSFAREQIVTFMAGLVFMVAALGLMLTSYGAMAKPGPKIVVMGDSLVAGYGLPPGKGFPEQLQQALSAHGVSVEIINAGVSGDTTSGGLARLDWSVGDGVDGVILELGANDALRGISPEVTRKNLEQIIANLKKKGIGLILVGMLAPPNMGKSYQEQFNAIYPALAEKTGVLFDPFFLEGVAADPSLNLADGIHPNEKGVQVMVQRFLPLAKQFVGQLSKTD